MAKAVRISRAKGSPGYQSVDIIVDPRTCDLDATMRDILYISDTIARKLPNAQMKSISINDHFAVAKVVMPDVRDDRDGTTRLSTLRLYKINGLWKIRGLAFA